MSRELQWIDIDDFTPGLRKINTAKMPPGVADPDLTVGCIATSTGGLTGLPGTTVSDPVAAADIPSHTSPLTEVHVVGFKAVPSTRIQATAVNPQAQSVGSGAEIDRDNSGTSTHYDSMFLIATESIQTSGDREWVYSVASPNQGTSTLVIDDTMAVPSAIHAFARSPIIYTTSTGDPTDGTYPSDPLYPYRAGKPTSFVSRQPLRRIDETGLALDAAWTTFMYPDITDPAGSFFTTFRDLDSLGLGGARHMVAHQARVLLMHEAVVGSWTNASAGSSGAMPNANYLAQWSVPNQSIQDSAISGAISFGPSPYDVGTMASLTASDLLIITQNDGAILVQGDVNSPSVRLLPGVPSTAGLQCDGASTQVGFVYGVGAGGVYAWQGTDGAVLLSPNLEDQFWVSDSAALMWNHKGSFAQWGDWLLAPNGYLMDFATGAWWRIDNAAKPAINWGVNGAFAFGALASYDGTDANATVVRAFNKFSRRSTWTWTSHPFVVTAHRRVHVRELVLVARLVSGTTGTVDVDLISDTGATVTYSFTVDSGITKAIRLQASFQAMNLRTSIRSTSGQLECYGLRVGYDERQDEVSVQ